MKRKNEERISEKKKQHKSVKCWYAHVKEFRIVFKKNKIQYITIDEKRNMISVYISSV